MSGLGYADGSLTGSPASRRSREEGQGGTATKPNRGFYDAAREPKQIWEVPDAKYIAAITTEPAEYERRVIAFFDDALLDTQ